MKATRAVVFSWKRAIVRSMAGRGYTREEVRVKLKMDPAAFFEWLEENGDLAELFDENGFPKKGGSNAGESESHV